MAVDSSVNPRRLLVTYPLIDLRLRPIWLSDHRLDRRRSQVARGRRIRAELEVRRKEFLDLLASYEL